ncbi:MAG TPA: lipoprotein-releasing ABC transporter permease subunit [Hypericibacter adhaerens]|jgi:lipoprotein-releasing system permease protein|uniref:lipoprotein-releasing ABC transporter permease subunit n=1 Tax=Hypericibacter adhaerens TaxID=2602016 RepID=UPI002C39E517|nr:lipoprotein-releasing ABC transporter permease subunit [Hypericibacter adhaerens]HWA46015.1 lipoprotein-releasing ABC transporter permease subunit [Hypericibacter adhaerens]
MFSAFERMMAMRYLRARRREGFISVIAGFSLLGIGLGVATLIIVMSVMNGFREELLSRILGINGHATVMAANGPILDYQGVADAIRGIPQIVSVTPMIEGQVMMTAGEQAAGALVHGMDLEDLRKHKVIADHIVAGTLDDFHGTDVIALGSRLAARMGVSVGGQVTLVTPQGQTTLMGAIPRMKTYKVVALFDIGMYEYDSSFAYVPMEAAQLYFKLPQAVNALEVMVQNPDRMSAPLRELYIRLGSPYRIYDWQGANSSFFNAVQVERNVMFIILTLIIIVAAFNIISGQIMLVKDKGRAIAILRTMGATRGMIMRIFLMTGASIGIVGTGFGFVLGLAFCENIETIRQWLQKLTGTQLFSPEIYFLSKLPAVIDWNEVIAVVVMALGLSLLATLYPSWRAARLDPVEALRYE